MNRFLTKSVLTLLCLVGTGNLSCMAQQRVLTLQEIYALADRQSQLIRVSERALAASKEGVLEARSLTLPTVEFSLNGSYIGNATLMSRGFSTSGTSEVIVAGLGPQQVANGKQATPHWGNSFTAQVSQIVYAGGGIRAGIRIAELGHNMAELDITKNRQEVRFMLTGLYLDLYRMQNQLRVVDRNIELTKKVIANMQAKQIEGTVLKNDITRYELQLQQQLLNRTKLLDASCIMSHQIATTLHLGTDTMILPDTLALSNEIRELDMMAAQECWQQMASENNIGIRQASVAAEIAEQKLKATKASSLPSVAIIAENNLFGPYTNDLIPINSNVNAWFVGIGVKYNLSSLWRNKHAIRQAQHEYEVQKEHVTLTLEDVENGVQANYVNFLTSFTEVKTQEKQVELAEQNYSVVLNRYQNDLALLTDILDASNTKLAAEIALVDARITLLYNYYKLKYITSSL